MLKKILGLVVVAVMVLAVFGLTACGDNKKDKIDIGGEIVSGKPSAICEVRVILDNVIFKREDKIKFTIGFGFVNRDIRGFEEGGVIVKLTINANTFIIINGENVKTENLYEKEFYRYSDDKFFCTRKRNRYIPNYYDVFDLMLNSNAENSSGSIQISAGVYEGNSGNGQTKWLFYASNSKKIAFSTSSVENAMKKL